MWQKPFANFRGSGVQGPFNKNALVIGPRYSSERSSSCCAPSGRWSTPGGRTRLPCRSGSPRRRASRCRACARTLVETSQSNGTKCTSSTGKWFTGIAGRRFLFTDPYCGRFVLGCIEADHFKQRAIFHYLFRDLQDCFDLYNCAPLQTIFPKKNVTWWL